MQAHLAPGLSEQATGSARLPRLCVIILMIAGLRLINARMPQIIIVASDARERAHWKAWEKPYINHKTGHIRHMPVAAYLCFLHKPEHYLSHLLLVDQMP